MTSTDINRLQLLLVDDEPKVINGLERNISIIEDDWEIHLANDALDGLEILDEENIDVIVSDLRMPGVSGAEFLKRAKKRHPHVLRFILSGYADQDLMLGAAGVAHRYVTKPCESQDIVDAIHQVYQTQALISNKDVVSIINDTNELHSGNQPLEEILKTTKDPEADISTLGALIEKHPTVHACVLHVANTAFFGAGGSVETIDDALQMLGMDFISSLAVMELSKSQMKLSPELDAYADKILNHCVATSQVALSMKGIIKDAKTTQALASMSLLHDLGKLVLLANQKNEYVALCEHSKASNRPCWKLEKEAYGCDHAAIGAYLFDLWGLPENIIRGVAWHHEPQTIGGDRHCLASLGHLANFAAHQTSDNAPYFSGSFDAEIANRFSLDKNFPLDLDLN